MHPGAPGNSCRWPDAERKGGVNKSIPTILGIGAAACVLLSMMMKNLVERDAEQKRSPHASLLEARFGAQLVGKVRILDELDGAWIRKKVRAKVRAVRDMRKLANKIGLELWLAVMRAGQRPNEVVVELTDADSGEASSFAVAAPAAGR